MLIEQPPFFYRLLFPGGHWRIPLKNEKAVYLTFDDGPIPEITPWVLELLDKYGIKATFFCVGDNVRKYPEIYQQVLDHGHQVGNHTFNHIQGIKTLSKNYIKNTDLASEYINSTLFRPPHGHMRLPQFWALRKKYKIVMWDVVTRDYSKRQTPEQVLENVKQYTRNGSIIVFHDSLKAEKNMKYALPLAIEWLLEQGYVFKTIEEEKVTEAVETNLHNSENGIPQLVRDYR
jgi:Predicted xylanase/chitin deacetylase